MKFREKHRLVFLFFVQIHWKNVNTTLSKVYGEFKDVLHYVL